MDLDSQTVHSESQEEIKTRENRYLLTPREELRPFEYPELEELAYSIINTHWIHDELDFSRDKHEYLVDLNDVERHIIGTILKTFAQTEIYVADEFWDQLKRWIPKPEMSMLCTTFTENEWRHALAYDRLNTELGLTDYKAFLVDEVATARFANLQQVRKDHGGNPNIGDLLTTLAIFGGFTEYVNLFSQFAILRSFSSNKRNKLINIGEIIDWSALDEQHHSDTALFIFNILKEENPSEWNDSVKTRIYEAATVTYDIEVQLIDQIFALGNLPNLSKAQLLNFMRNRINESLVRMGLNPQHEIDDVMLKEMSWFEDGLNANSHADFFAKRVTDYTKNLVLFTPESVKVKRDVVKSIAKL